MALPDNTESSEPRSDDGESLRHPEVMAELLRLQTRTPSWSSSLILLGISLLLFVGIGAAAWSWTFVVMLIPILLFHEMGHYVAMRIFHYRNLRMFFIPLLGAAVSGENYNVPGWKKCVVSFMGPLPGILAGIGVGLAGIARQSDLLLELAALTIFVNGFNLLPFLPLDGGWIMHAVLFSRHYAMDAGFRGLALAVLFILGIASGSVVLVLICAFMSFALPMSLRVARIAARLREEKHLALAAGNQLVPVATAERINDELQQAIPTGLSPKARAQMTLQIFESMTARPPGFGASAAIVAVHALSFVLALVTALTFAFVKDVDDWQGFYNLVANMPPDEYTCVSADAWAGPAYDQATAKTTIVATYPSQLQAHERFESFAGRYPPDVKVERFGQTLLLAIPAARTAAIQEWKSNLTPDAREIFLDRSDDRVRLQLVCQARDVEQAESLRRQLASPDSVLQPGKGKVRSVLLYVEIEEFTLERLIESAPQLARWLCENDCSQIQYRFLAPAVKSTEAVP